MSLIRLTLPALMLVSSLAVANPPSAPATADNPAAEARFLSNTRQLIDSAFRSGEGYFSPTGDKMVFQGQWGSTNPFDQVRLKDLHSGEETQISSGIGKTTCAFINPESGEIMFSSTHLDPDAIAKQDAELAFRASGKHRRYSWDYDENMDIFVVDPDGSNLRRLTTELGYDAEGNFSPDGSQIVFSSMRSAYNRELNEEEKAHLQDNASWFADIYIMNSDGSNVRQITSNPGYDGGPFFSPDGTRIIWRHFSEDGETADAYTMALDGTDVVRLTDMGFMSWAPYYHPSGEYVIFNTNKFGHRNFELFIVDIKGEKEPVRVTFTDGFDGLAVFLPNGKQLSWTSSRDKHKKSQIFIADWNHEAALEALKTAGPRLPPAVPQKQSRH